MAERFVVDTDQAQQVGDRLSAVGRAIEDIPPGPQPQGSLGTGAIEQAWSEFERSVATARQNLVRSVTTSADGFTAVANGTIRIDQQQAQQARGLRQGAGDVQSTSDGLETNSPPLGTEWESTGVDPQTGAPSVQSTSDGLETNSPPLGTEWESTGVDPQTGAPSVQSTSDGLETNSPPLGT